MYSPMAGHPPNGHNTIITINDMSMKWHHLSSSPYASSFPKFSLDFSSHPRFNSCFCVTSVCGVSVSLLYSVTASPPFLPSVYWKHKQYVLQNVPEPGSETGSSDCFSSLLCLFRFYSWGRYVKCHGQDQLHYFWDLCKMKMRGSCS